MNVSILYSFNPLCSGAAETGRGEKKDGGSGRGEERWKEIFPEGDSSRLLSSTKKSALGKKEDTVTKVDEGNDNDEKEQECT